jgi:uncharacterized protein (UPF0332 family)
MEEMTPRMRLATELLRDAQTLLVAGSLRSAMSRAYYAAYHACVDALERRGYTPRHFLGRRGVPADRWEHGIVHAEFYRLIVREGQLVEERLGRALLWLHERRIEADYRPEVAITPERAQEAVRLAEELVTTLQRLVM